LLTGDNIGIISEMTKLLPVLLLIAVFLSFSCKTTADTGSSGSEQVGDSVVYVPEVSPDSGNPDKSDDSYAVSDPAASAADTSDVLDLHGEAARAADPESESVIYAEPLSDQEFIKRILGLMPWNMEAVQDGNTPIIIMHDLDKNGYKDALVVAVEGGEGTENQLSKLSESARLFRSGQDYCNFLLLIFYQYSDGINLRYTVPVSQQLVFTGINPVDIKKGHDFPYALMFSFRTRSGIERELIILSGYGITRFTIKESLSEITLFEDIDEDGFEDIVVHEQGFEEGTGFETFLTWFKWNSREYKEYKTTNIVRNLKQFFLIGSEYLREGEYRQFLNYTVEPDLLKELYDKGMTDEEILSMIFKPVEPETVGDDFFTGERLTTVVFPEIMETPFSYETRMDFERQISVRIGRAGERSMIFIADLKMKKNPFQDKQFCFDIMEY